MLHQYYIWTKVAEWCDNCFTQLKITTPSCDTVDRSVDSEDRALWVESRYWQIFSDPFFTINWKDNKKEKRPRKWPIKNLVHLRHFQFLMSTWSWIQIQSFDYHFNYPKWDNFYATFCSKYPILPDEYSVQPDWAIFEMSWQQNFLISPKSCPNILKLFGIFWK